jgi:hypothetical protein
LKNGINIRYVEKRMAQEAIISDAVLIIHLLYHSLFTIPMVIFLLTDSRKYYNNVMPGSRCP